MRQLNCKSYKRAIIATTSSSAANVDLLLGAIAGPYLAYEGDISRTLAPLEFSIADNWINPFAIASC